jgi:hypothetical protein
VSWRGGDYVTDAARRICEEGRAGRMVRPHRIPEGIPMTRNEGGIDRALRIVAGLVLISLVFIGPQTPWGWIGVVPLVTGLIGWCPAYTLLGLNTCPVKR